MREFGDLGGIVVNVKTGRVVGGHQRLKHLEDSWKIESRAAKDETGTVAEGSIQTPWGRLAYREVAWTEAKEKAANLAANKHGGDFDLNAVGSILKDLEKDIEKGLEGANFDLDLTGFLPDERFDLLGHGNILAEENETPELPKNPNTKTGDIYRIGPHRLLCGDSSDRANADKLMGALKATLVFCDPPYGVSIGKKNAMLNTFQHTGSCLDDLQMDDMSPKELGDMLLKIFSLWRDFMADDCSVFVCSPQIGALEMMMLMMMKQSGLEVRHVLNWIKNAPTFSMGRLDYDYAHESILFTWKKTHKRKKEGAFQTSVWTVDKPRHNKHHPTMKPVELPICAILNHTDKKDVVVDMFLGSGTTLIAAENTGRIFYGMEASPAYCDVAIERWQNLTGRKAIKEAAK